MRLRISSRESHWRSNVTIRWHQRHLLDPHRIGLVLLQPALFLTFVFNSRDLYFTFPISICQSLPEIFAIKVESCQKSRRILDVFSPSQIFGGRPSKNCTHLSRLARDTWSGKKFMRILQLAPKLLTHTC